MAVPRRRVFYPFVILLLVLMFPGCWDRSQADTYVDIGGYRLAARCIGQGSPTVILESGLGSSSGSWRWCSHEFPSLPASAPTTAPVSR